jgi:phosphosulfolactate synthase
MLEEQRAFVGVLDAPLGGREERPRTSGLTMLLDKGLGLSATRDLLELGAPYVDWLKLGFGTAALYGSGLLRAKIALVRSLGVEAYPGGTFCEVAIHQGALTHYLDRCRALGFRWIEVSDGTIELPRARRAEAIREARDAGFQILTEIGKKDGRRLPIEQMCEQTVLDVEAGAAWVIVEGRETGCGVGLYDRDGCMDEAAMEQVLAEVPDPGRLIWEAPQKRQQEHLITRLGPNVNLGNIPPGELLALEAMRLGLRGDTFRLALERSEVI